MMLKSSQISHQPLSATQWPHPFSSGGATVASSPAVWRKPAFRHQRNKGGRVSQPPGKFTIKAVQVASPDIEQAIATKVRVIIKTQATKAGKDLRDYLVRSPIGLELFSAELERSGKKKQPIIGSASKLRTLENEVHYKWDAEIPWGFGEIGAVKVQNLLHNEIYIKSVECDGLFSITCNSWVASKFEDPSDMRTFFTKLCLPSQTPNALKDLRKEQLEAKQGNGTGTRQFHDRIYDYDVYNDLGNPDGDDDKMARPVLGGAVHPYPRRCRTGRQPCRKDPLSESRAEKNVYIPRDEKFSEEKESSYDANIGWSVIVEAILAFLKNAEGEEFISFAKIDSLFNEGVELVQGTRDAILGDGILSKVFGNLSRAEENMLRFQIPEFVDKDRFSWLRDEEFARQTLAGVNPYSIRLVKKEDWPLRSELDPTETSAITDKIVEQEIKEIGWTMTVEEALDQKRLFMLDYHDLLLPYVQRVSEISETTLYGSRTLFFLKPDDGTLKPIAIELTRPPVDEMPQWKQVYTPSSDATGCWLWRLAKVHVLSHDTGYHQLVTHWLRTHCAVEPYIIASNRRLSTMHPIYKLLHPHFRYTMDINARARQSLIEANGIIESSFFPSKYCMEFSSVAYDKLWRFDQEALPADLVSRGMAVEDPNAPHGVKLAIEDYPFANDGLLLWDAIKEWVSDYVNHYYPNASLVESDTELQQWWTEIRTVGHGDKKDQPWWPELKTTGDLINILTTMIWVTSGHHAAVNFGQYLYGAYFPNRPTVARTRMPHDNSSAEELKEFKEYPEFTLLRCLPTRIQAITVIVTLGLLSNHSEDEEYIGTRVEAAWEQDPIIKLAFERFALKLKEIEMEINKRNEDPKLENRCGAGVVPYELLKPLSGPGVTGKGVPYSISI